MVTPKQQKAVEGERRLALKAPFPWFGGKSRVASLVWKRFGYVDSYIEPFFGSGAVLLGRPHKPHIETINDKDCYVANFWRATKNDPEKTARYADWPVNEADLHARHIWLVSQTDFVEKMKTDPHFYDCKIAGWWVWGQSAWIAGGWCDGSLRKQRPSVVISDRGVHQSSIKELRPPNTRPHISNSGHGVHRVKSGMQTYFEELALRLRNVRVCCGDWTRVLGDSVTSIVGTTAVFLDPPYAEEANRSLVYSVDDKQVAHKVRDWAVKNGDRLRIALCGYEGEHTMPSSWECLAWKAAGGMSCISENSPGKGNNLKERIWFSPRCIRVTLL